MRKITQKNLVFLSLGFIFVFITVIDRNFSNYSLINYKDFDRDIIPNKLKTSDYLELNPFIIRDGGIGPSDYTWAGAASQPWCSGGGTKNNPYIISNIIINGQTQELSCIRIATSTVFFKIKDCIFYNSRHVGYAGIMLSHVLNGEIVNNKCFSNTVGIRIEDSDNINITNNIITDNEYGIMTFDSSQVDILFNNASNNDYGSGIRASNGDSYNISGNIANNNHYGLSVSNSNNILMENNYAKANYYGVGIYSTFDSALINTTVLNSYTGIDFMHSDNNVINYCDVYNSDGDVLDMYESSNNNFSFNKFTHNNWGLDLTRCHGNKFEQNEIASNLNYGISLFGGNMNTFVQNEVLNNDQGIYLYSGTQLNRVYRNIFKANGVNAKDSGIDNYWDNGSLGNYWGDYSGVDANNDGIGDSPYNISGSAGSKDHYPIWSDPSIPPIPGYNLFFLLGILSIVAFIIYIKNKKSSRSIC